MSDAEVAVLTARLQEQRRSEGPLLTRRADRMLEHLTNAGGAVASVLDEAFGMAATVAGVSGMTAEITVRFRAGTPYGVPVDLNARELRRVGP